MSESLEANLGTHPKAFDEVRTATEGSHCP